MSSYDTSYGEVVTGMVGALSGSSSTITLDGYGPISSDIPTAIYPADFKSQIEAKQNVITRLESMLSTTFASLTEMDEALATTYLDVRENTVAAWGNWSDGGVFFFNNGSADSCRVVFFFGAENYNGGVVFYTQDATINYLVQIDNTGNQYISNLPTQIASNGYYNSGIFFCEVFDYDDNSKHFINNNRLAINTGLCVGLMGYKQDTPIESFMNVQFYDSVESAINGYMDFYTDLMPSGEAILNYQYSVARTLQRRIASFGSIIDLNSHDIARGSLFSGAKPDEVSNPYGPSSSSGGGGYGDQTRYSEDTGGYSIPPVDMLNTGMVDLYELDKSQMQSFAQYLYSGITESASNVIKRMLVNPLEGVITAHMIRFKPSISGVGNIKFCGFDTGVSANLINKQYYTNKYEINLKNFWNTWLDYTADTKLEIFIPYVGIRQLDIKDFIGGTIQLEMITDIVSGAVNAHVFCNMTQKGKNRVKINSNLYYFTGNCALPIPLSSQDWKNTFSSLIQVGINAATENYAGVAASAANLITGGIMHVQKTGAFSSNNGFMGWQKPYIIVTHPEVAEPKNFLNYRGYKTNVTIPRLEDGFTTGICFLKVRPGSIDLAGTHATEEEQKEIKSLLESGIIRR